MNPRLREMFDEEIHLSHIDARDIARRRRLRKRQERLWPTLTCIGIFIVFYFVLLIEFG